MKNSYIWGIMGLTILFPLVGLMGHEVQKQNLVQRAKDGSHGFIGYDGADGGHGESGINGQDGGHGGHGGSSVWEEEAMGEMAVAVTGGAEVMEEMVGMLINELTTLKIRTVRILCK